MKKKNFWFLTGLSLGALSLVLVRYDRKRRSEVAAWQAAHRPSLDVLGHRPTCCGRLKLWVVSLFSFTLADGIKGQGHEPLQS